MENANNKKGSFMGLLPLVIFLVVYFAMGIGTGDFGNFPLMIGIFLASGISLFMKSPVAEKKSFTEKMVMFCKGGGDDTLILMVIIYNAGRSILRSSKRNARNRYSNKHRYFNFAGQHDPSGIILNRLYTEFLNGNFNGYCSSLDANRN